MAQNWDLIILKVRMECGLKEEEEEGGIWNSSTVLPDQTQWNGRMVIGHGLEEQPVELFQMRMSAVWRLSSTQRQLQWGLVCFTHEFSWKTNQAGYPRLGMT